MRARTTTAGRQPEARLAGADRDRVQAYLRRKLGSAVGLIAPAHRGASAQVRVGAEVLGTVDLVDDEGERSWTVTLVILADDLVQG